ncbi:MAG TPA: homoserine/homoserine lactone efflux protein [Candidatus Competibacteraceae bacterium]|nr:homoserine/homoserine lactone efflux protein [Candidatus Competibacteraceae bacterium]
MPLTTWLAFLAASIVLSVTPGPGVVNTMSNALSYGWRRSLAAIFGLQAGLAGTIVLVGVGLGSLIAASSTAFTALKWLGVGYLIYLGWEKWRACAEFAVDSSRPAPSPWKLFNQAVLVNLTNPKAIVFLVAFFPQFIDPARSYTEQVALMGFTAIVVDTLVMTGIAGLAAQLRRYVQDPRCMRLQNRLFGGLFMGAGMLLATAKS